MENPEFYRPDDLPTPQERAAIWKRVERALPVAASGTTLIHWKSFVFGAVASLLLVLAGIGTFSLLQPSTFTRGVPSLDAAYADAMNRLLQAAPNPAVLASEPFKMAVESRIRGIEDLDRMIEEMRTDMMLYGVTELKTRQLRSLYAMKMDIVKELVLEGEIAL